MTPEEFERICFQSHGQDLAALNYAQDRIIALAKDRDEWKATAMNMNDEKKSLMSKLHQLGLVAEGERANRIMVERRLSSLLQWLADVGYSESEIAEQTGKYSAVERREPNGHEGCRYCFGPGWIIVDNGFKPCPRPESE
jgi:hypothetical protein